MAEPTEFAHDRHPTITEMGKMSIVHPICMFHLLKVCAVKAYMMMTMVLSYSVVRHNSSMWKVPCIRARMNAQKWTVPAFSWTACSASPPWVREMYECTPETNSEGRNHLKTNMSQDLGRKTPEQRGLGVLGLGKGYGSFQKLGAPDMDPTESLISILQNRTSDLWEQPYKFDKDQL